MKFNFKLGKLVALAGIVTLLMLGLTACSNSNPYAKPGKLSIVTTTNVYADIAKNIVGKYGSATAIINKSSMDPHDYEPTTADAKELAGAKIIVANGLGYDSWMNKLAASINKKPVQVGEDLMHYKQGDNPHIWYNLNMPSKYVNYLVKRLSKLDHKHAAYFKANGQKYLARIARIKEMANKASGKDSKPVFVSEPVFDYALREAGYRVGNHSFEEAVEKETDPSPQVVQQMRQQIKARKIAFFVNNTQASSTTVNSFIALAKAKQIPVLNVRETIPDRTSYLQWMQDSYQKLIEINK